MVGLHIVITRSGRALPERSVTVPSASRTHVPPSGRMSGGALQGAAASASSLASTVGVEPPSFVGDEWDDDALHAVVSAARPASTTRSARCIAREGWTPDCAGATAGWIRTDPPRPCSRRLFLLLDGLEQLVEHRADLAGELPGDDVRLAQQLPEATGDVLDARQIARAAGVLVDGEDGVLVGARDGAEGGGLVDDAMADLLDRVGLRVRALLGAAQE